nr:hypothetical protein [Bacilli bacterium]
MRRRWIRSLGTMLIWIAGIEIVSSFAVKILYNDVLSFTSYFVIVGLIGLLFILITEFV